MYLAELTIEGFRKFSRLTLQFQKGLNIILGQNNIGKTAIVDALRALLSASDEGALRIDEYDFHVDAAGKRSQEINFKYVFRELSAEEEADFLVALNRRFDPSGRFLEYEAHFGVRYTAPTPGERVRSKRWCGSDEENFTTNELLEELRAVYLQPLRDPANGLRPSRNSQLARLVMRLSDNSSREEVIKALAELDVQLRKAKPIERTHTAIVTRHEDMLGTVLKQFITVGLTPPDFQRLAARLSIAVEKLDIEQNGLGYNNLIFMAVVLSELALNPNVAYKALIVEEPEAHLHPQLQAVLLQYLQSKENSSNEAVQVFVTSHSPNFASIASIDTVTCIHGSASGFKAFSPRSISFEKTKKEKLQRYLDVTRAELFFARRIIFVEGDAELFMLDVLARKRNIDLRKHSVSVLSTSGLNFDAFLPLFGDDALNVPVAVISDADPPDCYPGQNDPICLSDTAKSLQQYTNSFVRTFFARKTFEYDLALHAENQALMLDALADLHKNIADDLRLAVAKADNEVKARTLFCGMFERSSGRNIQKGAYAQALAQRVTATTNPFNIPSYIEGALDYITKS